MRFDPGSDTLKADTPPLDRDRPLIFSCSLVNGASVVEYSARFGLLDHRGGLVRMPLYLTVNVAVQSVVSGVKPHQNNMVFTRPTPYFKTNVVVVVVVVVVAVVVVVDVVVVMCFLG